MRDTPEAIPRGGEKLIARTIWPNQSRAGCPVLEVSSDFLMNLARSSRRKLSFSVNPVSSGDSTTGTANDHRRLIELGSAASFQQQSGQRQCRRSGGCCAHQEHHRRDQYSRQPRIRVKPRKAKVHVGDRTGGTTTNGTQRRNLGERQLSRRRRAAGGGSRRCIWTTMSAQGQPRGQQHRQTDHHQERPDRLSARLRARPTTVLRLKDGETQMLAGLVSKSEREDADRLPGLGNIPLLGRLFPRVGNENNKTEIVLLIGRPRIVRTLALQASDSEFISGTEGDVSTTPLRLKPSAAVDLRAPTGGRNCRHRPTIRSRRWISKLPQTGAQPFIGRGRAAHRHRLSAAPGGAPLKVSLSTPQGARRPGIQRQRHLPISTRRRRTGHRCDFQSGVSGNDRRAPAIWRAMRSSAARTTPAGWR